MSRAETLRAPLGGHISENFFKWFIGAVIGVLTTVGGAYISSVASTQKELATITYMNSQKIATIEARVDVTDKISGQRLDRMESKIDIIVDRVGTLSNK